MPDYSMCCNKDCSVKYTCGRFMAIPNEFRQSYLCLTSSNGEKCDSYFPVNEAPFKCYTKEEYLALDNS